MSFGPLLRSAKRLALILVFVLGFSAIALSSPETELAKRQQELLAVQKEIEEQKQNILSTKRQESTVSAELRRLQQQVDLAEKDLRYVEAQLAVTEEKTREAEAALRQAESALKQRTGLLNQRLTALYEIGPAGYAEVLLSATSFSDFLSRFDLISTIISQDVSLLKSLESAKQQHATAKSALEDQSAQLASIRNSQEAKRTQLASRSQDRSRYLTQIQRERQEFEEALDDLERTSQDLVKVIQELQAKSKVRQTGTFKPQWPVIGRITSPFGWRLHPVTQTMRNHTGIDIAVGAGTPVKAADSGVVLESGWLGGYGKAVIIDHGGGIATLYAHNSDLLVTAGQAVVKGQIISHAGSTGVSTGPHVHFEVRVQGTPVDPGNYLK